MYSLRSLSVFSDTLATCSLSPCIMHDSQVMDEKACICEMCDKTVEQNDLDCFNCKAPRSVKNKSLYKPLGAL